MTVVYLGLGSNIDPVENIRLGLRELRRRYGDLIISDVYQNEAIGFDGDDFLNLVVGLETDDEPMTIHEHIEQIHEVAGRQRNVDRFSARSLDIDLLLYGDLVITTPPLRLPRGDVLKYSFVLRPLAEIASNFVHPVTGRTLIDHWQECDAGGHPLTRIDVTL